MTSHEAKTLTLPTGADLPAGLYKVIQLQWGVRVIEPEEYSGVVITPEEQRRIVRRIDNVPGAPDILLMDIRPVHPAEVVATTAEGELVSFGNGRATRTNDVGNARYDLVPAGPHRRVATRYGDGADAHGPWNWIEGMPGSVIIQHMEEHLGRLKEKMLACRRAYTIHIECARDPKSFTFDWGDDDVAAFTWGGYALMWYQDNDIETFLADHTPPKKESKAK